MKKCTNLGCLKEYSEEENANGACIFHDGKPIFHDIKKGWTCCNQVVYDWDEFQKLKGCRIGKHTDEKKDIAFFKNPNNQPGSTSNDNESKGIVKESTVVVKDINEYEKEQLRLKLEKEKNQPVNKEPLKDKDGKLYCTNAGCKDKVYIEESNSDDACNYHQGKPVFHDLKKFWTCCKVETWDWDEFLKIPTCAKGRHQPKFK